MHSLREYLEKDLQEDHLQFIKVEVLKSKESNSREKEQLRLRKKNVIKEN
jgi:hypothetical protein